MAYRKEKEGDIIQIPFEENVCAYARMLIDGSYAVYDFFSDRHFKDFKQVINAEILFTTYVNIYGVKQGYWKIVANIPLEGKLQNYYPKYFNPSPMNEPNVNLYNMHKAEIEDAIEKDWIKTGRWQLDGTSDRVNLEERIRDYYFKKRHQDNSNVIWFFKKYLGLPIQNYLIPPNLKMN